MLQRTLAVGIILASLLFPETAFCETWEKLLEQAEIASFDIKLMEPTQECKAHLLAEQAFHLASSSNPRSTEGMLSALGVLRKLSAMRHRFGLAEEYARRALKLATDAYGDKSIQVAMARCDLATVFVTYTDENDDSTMKFLREQSDYEQERVDASGGLLEAEALYERAFEATRRDPASAAEVLQIGVAQHKILNKLILCYERQQKYDRARGFLEAIISDCPDGSAESALCYQSVNLCAAVCEKMGDYDCVADSIERRIKFESAIESSTTPSTRLELANAYLLSGRFGRAEQVFKFVSHQAASNNRESRFALWGLAKTYATQGLIARETEILQKLFSTIPDKAVATFSLEERLARELAAIYVQRGNHARAATVLREACTTFQIDRNGPEEMWLSFSRMLSMLVQTLMAQGEYDEAHVVIAPILNTKFDVVANLIDAQIHVEAGDVVNAKRCCTVAESKRASWTKSQTHAWLSIQAKIASASGDIATATDFNKQADTIANELRWEGQRDREFLSRLSDTR